MTEIPLDPVEAYDRIAPVYDRLAARRAAYLRRVEDEVIARLPAGGRSLLDLGAGDGRRALRIAREGGIDEVVLLEPSARMADRAPADLEIWRIRAEALDAGKPPAAGRRFDAVTCLWNVLGHVPTEAERARALAETGRLLAEGGRLLLDVNHRYNVGAYGLVMTAARLARDGLSFSERSGDVTVAWAVAETRCATRGHVFTRPELDRLARLAGLCVEERLALDYATGERRRSAFLGNLFYVLRRRADAGASGAGDDVSAPAAPARCC